MIGVLLVVPSQGRFYYVSKDPSYYQLQWPKQAGGSCCNGPRILVRFPADQHYN